MRIANSILLAAFICFSSPTFAQQTNLENALLKATLTGYIQPAYDRLKTSSTTLAKATHLLCKAPSARNLKGAQTAFTSVAIAWAHIEWLRVGPVMADNVLERVLFYPDRKGTGLKQVQRALAKADQTATNATRLSQKSVAMQGLGALEFILFGTGHERLANSDTTYRCQYASAIGTNLQSISETVHRFWSEPTSVTENWLIPSDRNPWFRDQNEAVSVLVGTVVHGLEAIKDIRLGAFLRKPPKRNRPKSALLWRSQNTMRVIAENLIGLKRLFEKSAVETVLPPGHDALANNIRFEFDVAIETARSLDQPVAKLLSDEETRERLLFLKQAIKNIIVRLDDEFFPAIGLFSGFSFADGD